MSYMMMGDSGVVVFARTGTVDAESVSLSSRATSNPIEGGSIINDHAVCDPISFTVSGVVTGSAGRSTLEAMWRNRDLITYRGIESYDNLLITSLTISRAANNAGGYTFKVGFRRMEIASSAFVALSGPTMSQQDAGADRSAGTSRSSKPASENGLLVTGSEYVSYVASYSGASVNTEVASGRTNPAYAGYGGNAR